MCGRGRWCSAGRSTESGGRRSTSWRCATSGPATSGGASTSDSSRSPVGLSILENRPDRNPVVSPHSTLYLPIPRYETGTPTTFLLAASYPLGAKVTVSGSKWDVRAAVTDSSPIRGRPFFGDDKPPRMANVMVGGGFTPHIGSAVWRRRGLWPLRRRVGSARPIARRSHGVVSPAGRRVVVPPHAAGGRMVCGRGGSWRRVMRASTAAGLKPSRR